MKLLESVSDAVLVCLCLWLLFQLNEAEAGWKQCQEIANEALSLAEYVVYE